MQDILNQIPLGNFTTTIITQTDQIMEFACDTNNEEVKDEKEIDERSRYVMWLELKLTSNQVALG